MTAPRKTKKAAARPVAAAPAPDELAARLIEAGLVPNAYVLSLNDSLQVPHAMELPAPWNLPSRLFRFPVETSKGKNGTRRIGLMHPLLADHPFVQQVEAALGLRLDPHGAPNDCGYSNTGTAQWWHAVDLVGEGRWRDLLATAEFTTPGNIARAVAYGLDYGAVRTRAKAAVA